MKIFYIDYYGASKDDLTSGVERKISAHLKELSKIGNVQRFSINTEKGSKLLKITRMLTRRMPFTSSKIPIHYSSTFDDIDAIYFRKTLLDRNLIRFFRDVKHHNPSCRILMEIPTYPYDSEMLNVIEFSRFLKDWWNRRKLHRYIDRIISFYDNGSEIFSVPVINTMNGIDFNTISLRNVKEKNDGKIHAIMVANFAPWHGLDRLIDGMRRYYESNPEKEVILHIVGGGKAVEEEKKKISGKPYEQYVVFHGRLTGNDLGNVYDISSIAIDTCNFSLQGVNVSSTLKTREYVAKGLPIIGPQEFDIREAIAPYSRVFSNPERIDIKELVEFHEELYGHNLDHQAIAADVRRKSKKVCDMSATMAPVLTYLSEGSCP